jgi:hypothetical protein
MKNLAMSLIEKSHKSFVSDLVFVPGSVKVDKKNDNKANSAVVASSATVPSATTTLNNRYAALLATLATMKEEE